MSKHRTDFEMSIDVDFLDAEKAVAFFIDGEWKNSFYTCTDLDGVAEHLACGFHHTPDVYDLERHALTKFIEGFGMFIHQGNGSYKTADDYTDGGRITVIYDMELEATGTYMVVPF